MRFTASPVLPIWLPMQKPELLLKITSHGSRWLLADAVARSSPLEWGISYG
jgi:hypothetical protein